MTAELWAGLVGIVGALGAVLAAFLRGKRFGREAEQHRQANERLRHTQERINADIAADRTADPVGELRRDWSRVRSVETNLGARRGQSDN